MLFIWNFRFRDFLRKSRCAVNPSVKKRFDCLFYQKIYPQQSRAIGNKFGKTPIEKEVVQVVF